MKVRRRALCFVLLSVFVFASWAAGCAANAPASSGTKGTTTSATTGGSSTTSTSVTITTTSSSCTNLGCQIHSCPGALTTTISGTIYDPAGKVPLYGVVAYVPNSTPAPINKGAGCYTCSSLYTGNPLAAAVTDATGHFTIPDAPDGPNIPLVIQIGKWRRQFVIPNVGLCTDTALPDKMLSLPKNGSEGDMPEIAISTGPADVVECLFHRMGVDDAEYVPGTSSAGHLHVFASPNLPVTHPAPNTNPPGPPPETNLWDSFQDIMNYDLVVLSCEGYETVNMNQQVLFDYAAAGGRVFANHYHYAWFYTGPFATQNLATWTPATNSINNINGVVVTTAWDGTTFTRGQALYDWLLNVKALSGGYLPIIAGRHNADVTVLNTPSQPWLVVQGIPTEPQYFTFDTPLGAPPAMQCGRVMYTDMHVGAASPDYGGTNLGVVPDGCVSHDLTPQELALEFTLFDLSSCVTPSNMPQMPPPVTK